MHSSNLIHDVQLGSKLYNNEQGSRHSAQGSLRLSSLQLFSDLTRLDQQASLILKSSMKPRMADQRRVICASAALVPELPDLSGPAKINAMTDSPLSLCSLALSWRGQISVKSFGVGLDHRECCPHLQISRIASQIEVNHFWSRATDSILLIHNKSTIRLFANITIIGLPLIITIFSYGP
jgi:hypothetical protein